MSEKLRQELVELHDQANKMADRMTEIVDLCGETGTSGSLNDKDGFPRADIDITRIVTLRNEYNCLNNDHLLIMKKLERSMHEYFNSTK